MPSPFVFNVSPHFTSKILITLPDGSEQTFEMTFKALNGAGLKKISQEGHASFLTEVIVGWDGIQDQNGKPLPFSKKLLSDLLDLPWVANRIAEAYGFGLSGASENNLKKSPRH